MTLLKKRFRESICKGRVQGSRLFEFCESGQLQNVFVHAARRRAAVAELIQADGNSMLNPDWTRNIALFF
jgi:hypothetical protein